MSTESDQGNHHMHMGAFHFITIILNIQKLKKKKKVTNKCICNIPGVTKELGFAFFAGGDPYHSIKQHNVTNAIVSILPNNYLRGMVEILDQRQHLCLHQPRNTQKHCCKGK